MAKFYANRLGEAMGQAGQALGGLGQTVYDIEAEQEFRAGQLALASATEEFKKQLWTDPDYGTPGVGDGYVAKFQNFMQGTKDQTGAAVAAVEGTGNAKAKDLLHQYSQQMLVEQLAEVEELQFTKWREGTNAKSDARILEAIDKFGTAESIKAIEDELGYRKANNLITEEEYLLKASQFGQVAMRKDLAGRAKAIYAEQGLSAALRMIADDQETYSIGGQPTTAGDQVKTFAKSDLTAYDATIQADMNDFLQQASANFRLEAEWYKTHDKKKEPYQATEHGFLTHGMIESEQFGPLNASQKEYWHNWLDGRAATLDGGKNNKDQVNQVKNFLQCAASNVDVYRNSPQTRFTMNLLGKPWSGTVPELITKINEVAKYYDGMLSTDPEWGDLYTKINKTTNGRGEGLSSGPADVKAYILSKEAGLSSARQAEMLSLLSNWTQENPGASSPDLLARAKAQVGAKAYGKVFNLEGRFGKAAIGKDLDDDLVAGLQQGVFYGGFLNNNGVLTPANSQNRDALLSLGAYFEGTVKKAILAKDPKAKFEIGENYSFSWNEQPDKQWMEINARKLVNGYPTGDGDVYKAVLDAAGHSAVLRETYKKGQKPTFSILTQEAFESGEFREAEEMPNKKGWDLSATVKAGIARAETEANAAVTASMLKSSEETKLGGNAYSGMNSYAQNAIKEVDTITGKDSKDQAAKRLKKIQELIMNDPNGKLQWGDFTNAGYDKKGYKK